MAKDEVEVEFAIEVKHKGFIVLSCTGGRCPGRRQAGASYKGESIKDCKAQARKDGWRFTDSDTLCPTCAHARMRLR